MNKRRASGSARLEAGHWWGDADRRGEWIGGIAAIWCVWNEPGYAMGDSIASVEIWRRLWLCADRRRFVRTTTPADASLCI